MERSRENVVDEPVVGEVTYHPHRAVIREDKSTTKVRVVLDCSAKNKGPSLNASLHKGPVLSSMMYDVMLLFRLFDVAMISDIEKAYLQILVAENDRDFFRILWFDDITKENPEIVKLRFTRVVFGASPSQFLLNAVVKKHVEK